MALVIIIAFIAFSGISTNVEYKNVEYKNVDKVALAANFSALTSRNLYNPYNGTAGSWSGPNGATLYSDHITNSVKVDLSSSSAFGGYFTFRVSFTTKGIYTISCQAISDDSLVYNSVRVCNGIGTEIIPYTQIPSNQRTSLTVDTSNWTGPNTLFIYLKPSLVNGFPSGLSSISVEYQNLMVEFGSEMTDFCNWFTVAVESYGSDSDSESDYDSGFNNGYDLGYCLGNFNGLGKYRDNIYTYHYLYSMAISGSSSWVSQSTQQDTVSFSITVLSSQFQLGYMHTLVDVPGPGKYYFSCDPLDESTPGTGVTSNYKIEIEDNATLTKDNTNWVQNGEIEFTVDESHYDPDTNKYRIRFKYYVTDYSNPNNTTCKWSFNNHKIVSEEYRTLTDSYYTEGRIDGIELGNEVGYQEGYDEGFDDGEETGYQEGYEEGVSVSYDVGYEAGRGAGYSVGYSEGLAVAETVDGSSLGALGGAISGTTDMFVNAFDTLSGIEVFGITLGSILALAVAIAIVVFIIKMVKR